MAAILRIRGIRVDRRQLVGSIYRAFRAMTTDPDYHPCEWEIHPQSYLLGDFDDEEYELEYSKFPYTGCNLRQLTPRIVKSYLTEDADPERQLSLFDQ